MARRLLDTIAVSLLVLVVVGMAIFCDESQSDVVQKGQGGALLGLGHGVGRRAGCRRR